MKNIKKEDKKNQKTRILKKQNLKKLQKTIPKKNKLLMIVNKYIQNQMFFYFFLLKNQK